MFNPIAVPFSRRGKGVALFVFCLLLGGLLTLVRGQDNWWDILNYHIYNPWRLLTDRQGDFFVAGIQGYFHPLADVPYYLLAWEWLPTHPRLVGFLAGLPYGALIFLSLQVSRRLLQDARLEATWAHWSVALLTTGTAVTGVATWTQAGTTTNEVTVAVFVLAAGLLLVREADRHAVSPRIWRNTSFLVGLLLGAAAGLKLTATIYAPAGGLALLLVCRKPKDVLVVGIHYLLGWWFAFAAIYGPWAWHLYRETGNPLFPMFNNLFNSSYSRSVPGRDLISMPHSLAQWLFYPFFWLDASHPSVYNRLLFRDGRFAFFYLAGLVLTVTSVYSRLRRRILPRASGLWLALAFASATYLVWLVLFSMLRYAVALEVLCSIVAMVILVRLAGSLPKHATLAQVSLALLASAGLMATTKMPDVHRVDYGSRVFQAQVPDLEKNPLVVFSDQPMGLLAPLIQARNPTAIFVGIQACFQTGQWCRRGFYAYGLGDQLRSKVREHRGPLYVVYYASQNPSMPQLAAFGVYPDMHHCRPMHTNVTPDVSICAATKGKIADLSGNPYRLEARILASPATEVHLEWLKRGCSTHTELGQFEMHWRTPEAQQRVQVYIQAPPARLMTLFAGGGASGSAKTGDWVQAGENFILKQADGSELARVRVGYAPCTNQP